MKILVLIFFFKLQCFFKTKSKMQLDKCPTEDTKKKKNQKLLANIFQRLSRSDSKSKSFPTGPSGRDSESKSSGSLNPVEHKIKKSDPKKSNP